MRNIQENTEEAIKKLYDDHKKNTHVVIGLSGGVDSAVSAWILKEARFDVTAVFLTCYPNTPGCKAEQDLQDAIKVASFLKIPLRTLDFIKEYREGVLNDFYEEYRQGRTPNPDILCNSKIKFGSFFGTVMRETGADYFATGHYVRTKLKVKSEELKVDNGKHHSLLRGVDNSKDQSYFLYRIPQEALDKTIFPIGGMTKEQVREVAQEVGLPVSDKPDSTGICFIGHVDLIEFLKAEIKEQPGKVITKDGDVIGSHSGVWFYTFGQRRGFETTVNEPLYVIGKDIEENKLVVGTFEETFATEFMAENLFWRELVADTFLASVRIRNLGELVPAAVKVDREQAIIHTDTPIQAVAPGQSVVFYDDEVVLGGGIIR